MPLVSCCCKRQIEIQVTVTTMRPDRCNSTVDNEHFTISSHNAIQKHMFSRIDSIVKPQGF